MYGIYARQSVEKQDSISIEMQIDLCMGRVPENETAEVYADRGCTGTNTKRREYQRMLSDIRHGRLSGVIVYKLDRISRSLLDFARLSEELEAHSVKLCSYSEELDSGSPMGKMIIRLLIMFAEMEQQMISQRIRDNYKARALKGMSLGGTLPYGYNKDLTINDTEAETVRLMYSQLLTGMSLDAIARNLNENAVSSPEMSRWTGQQVSRHLKNTAYVRCSADVREWLTHEGIDAASCGEFSDGKGVITIKSKDAKYAVPGRHDGIIEPDVWLAVQDVLLRRKPSQNGGSGETSWLQGLCLCGKCGSSCYVRGNGKGSPYIYLVCRGKRLGTCTGLKAVRTEKIERLVGSVISREIRKTMVQSKPQSDRELLGLAGKRECESRGKMSGWRELKLNDKKAAAAVLIKNVVLTEDVVTVILR